MSTCESWKRERKRNQNVVASKERGRDARPALNYHVSSLSVDTPDPHPFNPDLAYGKMARLNIKFRTLFSVPFLACKIQNLFAR